MLIMGSKYIISYIIKWSVIYLCNIDYIINYYSSGSQRLAKSLICKQYCDARRCFNSFPPGQNGRHFADDDFKCIFVNENVCIVIEISLTFVP